MRVPFLAAAIVLAACVSSPTEPTAQPTSAPTATAAAVAPVATDAPAGRYTMDPNHASLLVRVAHFGFSNYTARFTRFTAQLNLDPTNPANSSVVATVDPASIRTEYPGDYRATHTGTPYASFEEALTQSDRWLNAGAFPQVGFTSTRVTLTGPNTADIEGTLTMRGVSHPAILHATFNRGVAHAGGNPTGPARVGFSARGAILRSDFGMQAPPAGQPPFASDAVEIIIEAEFAPTPG